MPRMISENEKRAKRFAARRAQLIATARAKGCTDPERVVDALVNAKDLVRLKRLGVAVSDKDIARHLASAAEAAGSALPPDLHEAIQRISGKR